MSDDLNPTEPSATVTDPTTVAATEPNPPEPTLLGAPPEERPPVSTYVPPLVGRRYDGFPSTTPDDLHAEVPPTILTGGMDTPTPSEEPEPTASMEPEPTEPTEPVGFVVSFISSGDI